MCLRDDLMIRVFMEVAFAWARTLEVRERAHLYESARGRITLHLFVSCPLTLRRSFSIASIMILCEYVRSVASCITGSRASKTMTVFIGQNSFFFAGSKVFFLHGESQCITSVHRRQRSILTDPTLSRSFTPQKKTLSDATNATK